MTTTQDAPTAGPTSAMRRAGEVAQVVAADAAALYHRVADVTRTPEWSAETRRCDWLDGATAAQPGARFRGRNGRGLQRWTRVCEVLVADPGREFSFRTVPERGKPDSTRWTFRFEPVAGGTRVTHAYELELPQPRILERLSVLLLPYHRDRRPDMAASLRRIAAAAEGRDPARQPRLGQAHTAEGPLDLGGMYVMHHGFRRDLRDFTRAVPVTPPGDGPAWRALSRRWAGFGRTLHHHHRVEDVAIWPALEQRAGAAGDTAARDTLAAMENEHTHIDPLLAACAEGFETMVAAPDVAVRDRLAAGIGRLHQVLSDHLAHEETDALPLAQRYLSLAAWQDSEAAARKEFGLSDLTFTVPWCTRELPPAQFDLVFAKGGPMIRAVLALTRRRFDREHARAFRHLPPAPGE